MVMKVNGCRLEAEVFPNTDLRQQHAVTVGYHLPHAANPLGDGCLRFIHQRHLQLVVEKADGLDHGMVSQLTLLLVGFRG